MADQRVGLVDELLGLELVDRRIVEFRRFDIDHIIGIGNRGIGDRLSITVGADIRSAPG